MNEGAIRGVIAIGFVCYIVAALGMLYYTYRLDRLTVDVKVQSDQRRHGPAERFVNDFNSR